MNHRQVRARIAEVMAGIDSGRWPVGAPTARRLRDRKVGAPVLAVALGLGVAGCPSSGPEPSLPPPITTGPTPDPGAQPEYMAPDPGPTPDPGVQPEYMAPDPGTVLLPEPPADPGATPVPIPQPLYGEEPPPPPPPTGRRRVRPVDPGPVAEYMAPDPGPVALYAAPVAPKDAPSY